MKAPSAEHYSRHPIILHVYLARRAFADVQGERIEAADREGRRISRGVTPSVVVIPIPRTTEFFRMLEQFGWPVYPPRFGGMDYVFENTPIIYCR